MDIIKQTSLTNLSVIFCRISDHICGADESNNGSNKKLSLLGPFNTSNTDSKSVWEELTI